MNLKNIVVSVGLFALLASPVFANEPTTAHPEGTAPAGDAAAHPDHHGKKKASVTKTKGKKGKTTEAPAPAAPSAEGTHPDHPTGN